MYEIMNDLWMKVCEILEERMSSDIFLQMQNRVLIFGKKAKRSPMKIPVC